MKVFLVETIINGKLEPIAIKTNFELATRVFGEEGIITEMELDEEYFEGIGACQHWHFGEGISWELRETEI